MTTWDDVREVAVALPRARAGEDSVDVGRHPFVRRRVVDGRTALQVWCWAEVAPCFRARPEVFLRVDVFSVKASVWAWLDRLPADEVSELVSASYDARLGRRAAR